MQKRLLFLVLWSPLVLLAQKKPLDHTVYDSWQSLGERMISNDGKWVIYTVTPQEGDAVLFIKSIDGGYQKQIARGYNAQITDDSRYLICKIKPFFKDTREARLKKKKPEEFPKDSIAIVELGKEEVTRSAMVRSYKIPEKASGWMAYLKDKELPAKLEATANKAAYDSLKRKVDSLTILVTILKNTKAGNADRPDADEDPASGGSQTAGGDLVVRKLNGGKEMVFKNVVDYYFNAYGQKLLMITRRSASDRLSVNAVLLLDTRTEWMDTILKGGNDFRNGALTEDGSRLAFLADRDTTQRAQQKNYGLYLYRNGDDSAALLIDRYSAGMKLGMTVSENGTVSFSKSGNRLFFGTVPQSPVKDTSTADIDQVKLDIWNYKDDYLQTQQLFQLNTDLKRSYLAVYDFALAQMKQLASKEFPTIIQTKDGDGDIFIAVTDTGRRIQSQWEGRTKKDVYALDLPNGKLTLVKKNLDGTVYPSSTGKFILLYDLKARQYFAWNGKALKNITARIRWPLYNEEDDEPDDPNPYGIMGWHEGDSLVYIYDRYDIWKVDPAGILDPVNFTGNGRKENRSYRQVKLDPDERYFTRSSTIYLRGFEMASKRTGIFFMEKDTAFVFRTVPETGPYAISYVGKAKYGRTLIWTQEDFTRSQDLWHFAYPAKVNLTRLNPQQSQYNWGTAELYHWKTFDGKKADGILYKPENFDSTKKYPMIVYFYERLTDSIYKYQAPAPTGSRINISFFVSRGYLVFAPDIRYTKGHPGKDAYNYIVSGVQSLARKKWVDAKNIGLQGQSWGGYQVAYVITQTNMFKAAWAGAPVVNMFSAYGGIRWESGINRQFQYEKSQSRIGATPWERPDLYIENSPFFHLKKITTPLVIMSNDADGAVPWYQGIEFFTAMRRVGKPVWLLNYNGEAHNVVERKNKKDLQIREQQYFDWLLKGAKPPAWIVEGVPAVRKGRDWGFELVD